jgi:hypothetical protein
MCAQLNVRVRWLMSARVKAGLKSALGPCVRAARPMLETIGALETRVKRRGLKVRWFEEWTAELNAALNALPPVRGWPHDLYRQLTKPTDALKRHALVQVKNEPVALLSLRRCASHWEPVAYQSIPAAIAPARDHAVLARALASTGVEVRVPAGLGAEVAELRPSDHWGYDCFQIDLCGDYEKYWRERKRQKRLRRCLRDSAHMVRRVDGAGDLEWIVEQWRAQWQNDPGQEVVAAADRLNFWTALTGRRDTPLQVHTLMLLDGSRRAAGLILLSNGELALTQCSARDPAYSDSGTATNLFAVEWAKQQGLHRLDLGSGAYKRDWGPVGARRYGAVFRPYAMHVAAWASP